MKTLILEHLADVADVLDDGWGPWRLGEDGVLRHDAGNLEIAVGSTEPGLAINKAVATDLSAADLGHLIHALVDCTYARDLGAGPWGRK